HPYPGLTPPICSPYLPKSLGKTHLPLLEVFLDKYIKLLLFFSLLCHAKKVSFPVFRWLFSTFSALFLPILSPFRTYFFVYQSRFSCYFTASPSWATRHHSRSSLPMYASTFSAHLASIRSSRLRPVGWPREPSHRAMR